MAFARVWPPKADAKSFPVAEQKVASACQLSLRVDLTVASCGFDKSKRLSEAAEFQAIFDKAEFKASSQHFLFLARANQWPSARVGLVISKKNVRLATQRNRIKRSVRESFRCLADYPGLDTVVLARRGADKLNNSELRLTLNALWRQLSKRATKNSN